MDLQHLHHVDACAATEIPAYSGLFTQQQSWHSPCVPTLTKHWWRFRRQLKDVSISAKDHAISRYYDSTSVELAAVARLGSTACETGVLVHDVPDD